MSSNQRGFTIPELIIAMAVSAAIMVGIITLLINLSSNGTAAVRVTEQIRSNQATIADIQADLPLTTAFLATNSLADPNASASPLGASGWQIRGNGEDSRILILRTYATTTAPQDSARKIVYFDNGMGGCPVGQLPVTNNVIYFVKDNTLYRRLLREPVGTPSAPYCAGQSIAQLQTCANPAPATNCSTRDVVVARNIRSFRVQYFTNPTDITPIDAIYTSDTTTAGNLLSTATTIRVDVESTTANPDDTPMLSSYRKMIKGTTREL